MSLDTLLYGAPSVSVARPAAEPAAAPAAAYLQADGTTTATLVDTSSAATAPTAGALAILAVAGLIGLRIIFRGALD